MQVFKHTLPGENLKITDKDAGHIYVSSLKNGKMEQKAVFMRNTFRSLADEQYVTASAFYHPAWGRSKKNLRWINALVLDFDGQQEPHDLAIRIANAGLPSASMMVRTPSSGIHAWWFLKPVRGTRKAIRLYESLHASLAAELGADPAAVGAERFWRLPTSANVIYSNSKKYKLSVFRTWRDETRPEDMPGQVQRGQVYAFAAGLLAHPAIKQLQQGVSQGRRDNACFALAVAHLVSGGSVVETEQILLTWNQFNSPAMREEKVIKCVASAAKGLNKDYQHYYNAMRFKIREITGLEIKYRPITQPKAREERKRSHAEEWKQDLITHIEKRGGRMLTSLRRLAKELKIPLSSLKEVLAQLEKEGIIYRDAVGSGRKSFTVLMLTSNYCRNCKKQMGQSGIHYGTAVSRGELSGSFSQLHDAEVCLQL